MADSILRLRVQSDEYNNKLKQATEQLSRYADGCRKAGGTLQYVDDGIVEFARSLGKMETSATTARGQLAEMTKAFTEWSVRYNKLTDEEKKGEFGKALSQSLDQLKSRLQSAKKDLADVQQELNGSKFGQLGSILDGIGQKMGLNANITELLTSKTAMMTAGLGAATAIVGKATQEWAKYNAELAKQDQITTVTTGLKGPESDRMTNQARALTDTYGVDFREAINAANTLMTQFGQTGEQAMSLIRDGMQGMIQGDGPKLLSMIQQYAPAFRDAGVTASQLVAVIQNSEGGIFTDQNMNAIVMGIKNIRLMTKATSDALAQLGIDGQQMSQQLRDGSLTIFDAMKQVATQIQGVNSNSQAAGEVMQQVFGRQGAMAGTKLGEAIATLNTNLEETKRQTGEVGDAYNDLYNANVKLNGAIRDCFEYDGWDQMATGIKAKLVSALASVLDYLGKIKGALGGFSVGQQQGDTRNGGGQFVDRAVDRLRGGNTPGKQQIYTRQIQAYSGKILDINDQIRQIQEKAAQDMDGNMAVVYEKQIRNLENRKQAIQRNMAEYDKRAQAVLNGTETTPAPVINPITNTSPKGGNSGKSVKTEEQLNNDEIQKLTQEYIKASDDRRKAIEGEIKTLQDRNKEIARLKDMALGKIGDDGSLPAMTQQLKELQSAQSESANGREWDDYQKKIDDVTAKINVLKGVLPKDQQATFTVEVNAEQLEQLRMLLPNNEDTVRVNVEEGTVNLPEIPKDDETIRVNITATTADAMKEVRDMVGEIEGWQVEIEPKIEIKEEDIRTPFEKLKDSLKIEIAEENMQVDTTTLQTLMKTAIQNGIDGLDPNFSALQEKMREGMNIPDETWQALQDEINEKLKELGIEPIKIDFKTGNISNGKQENPTAKAVEKFNGDFSKVTGGVSSIVSGIQQMGVDIPNEIQNIFGVLSGISSIMTGITAILTLIEIDTKTTAAASVTDALIPFARGGIVHAANGFVPGNNYSGDMIPAALNAGELVLNKAQQGNLASQLQGAGMGGMQVIGEISGEKIVLVANRFFKRTGQGEIVTW